MYKTLLALFLLAPAVAHADKVKFMLDGGGGKDLVQFTSEAPFENFSGRTSAVTGTIQIDPANIESGTVEFTVDLSTLQTGIDGRDKHMKSPEYLDTAKFAKATFKSTRIKPLAGKALGHDEALPVEVTGDLTIKGVTKPVTTKVYLRFHKGDGWSQKMLGPGDILSATTDFNIKMTDFGMKVPQYLVMKVADEVRIFVKVNARTQAMS